MVNSLLNAVTKQLGTTFGNKYRYYVEDVEQNLTKPCFTADVLIPLQRSKSPILYDRTIPIVVHYFSDSETNIKQDCYILYIVFWIFDLFFNFSTCSFHVRPLKL